MFFYRHFLSELSIQTFHLNQYFLIVSTQNTFESLREMFETTLKLGLLRVNVLMNEGDLERWSLHNYTPYISGCNSFVISKINTFTLQNYTNQLNNSFSDVFPSKPSKFNNCSLHIVAFPIAPLVIIQNISNGTLKFDGIEVVMVNEISTALNLIPKYVESPDKRNRGVLLKNGTATGALKMVNCSQ